MLLIFNELTEVFRVSVGRFFSGVVNGRNFGYLVNGRNRQKKGGSFLRAAFHIFIVATIT